MRHSSLILLGASALLLHPIAPRAQDVLSFEPGGKQACAKAIHQSIPGPGDNPRGFDYECDERDLAIEKTRLAALSKSMDNAAPDQRVAFNALMVGFTDFRDAHIDTEAKSCTFGTGCGEMIESDKARINHDFLQMAGGHPVAGRPHFTADDLAQSDSALNTEYQKAFSSLPDTCSASNPGCVSQAAFRNTQRMWIRFRDAWVTFAQLRWPEINSDSWMTYLTRQRTKQIETGPEP
jgi:hypothetical protein